MQLHLVEESLFTADRVLDHRRARRADLQFVVVQPAPLDTRRLATALDIRTRVGLEKMLPGHVQLVGESTYVEQALVLETLAQECGQALIHLPAIDHRGGTANRRRQFTEEQLFARPAVLVGTFVVEEDHLLLRIRRGAVGVLAAFLLRQVTVLAIQPRLHSLGEGLEVLRGLQAETAEQNAAMSHQFAFDLGTVLHHPVGQAHTGIDRFDQQRKGLPRYHRSLAHCAGRPGWRAGAALEETAQLVLFGLPAGSGRRRHDFTVNRHSDLSQLDVWVAQHLAQDVQPATQQCLDPFCLEQLCGVLPGDAPAVRDRVDEQRHVEFRIAARLRQHLHTQVGQAAMRHRHVVHHEQHLHQRVHAWVARRASSLDDQVERQCLLLAGIEQGGAGARQPRGEVQLFVQLRAQWQDIDEEADQRLKVGVFAAGDISPEQ
ncbi:hypothetical protein D3C81_583150 [compost metagenome]